MGIIDRKLESIAQSSGKKLIDNMKVLQDHQLTIQKNQCEQEAYLKDITERLKRIETKLK
jgi:hypothetical protein